MRTGLGIALGIALGTLLAAVATATVAVPAVGASGPQFCTDGGGVTVVVDLGDLDPDAGVVVRCADGAGRAGYTGFDALADAGISVVMPDRQPGMVCRLAGRPAPGEPIGVDGEGGYVERCVDAPPTQAYWSYWYAAEGGSWRYSPAGPGNRDAIAGGFEGWSFSLNHSESSAPAPRVAPDNPNAPYEDGGGQGGGHGGHGGGQGGEAGGQGVPPAAGTPTDGPSSGSGSTAGPRPPAGVPPSPPGPPATRPPPSSPPTAAGSSNAGSGLHADPDGGQRPRPAGADPARDGDGSGGDRDAGKRRPDRPEDTAGPDLVLTGDVPDEPSAAGSGPPASTLAGAGALVGLVLAVGAVAWRRRVRGTSLT